MNYQDIISPYYINTISSSQVLGISQSIVQSPVVQRPISNNPGLRFNLGFFVSFFKSLFQTIFSILFCTSKHQIVEKKNYTEYSFKAFIPEVRFHNKPWLYCLIALNNPAQGIINCSTTKFSAQILLEMLADRKIFINAADLYTK